MIQETNLEQYRKMTENLAPYDLDLILDRFSKVEMTTEDVKNGQSGLARCLALCLTEEDGRKLIKCVDRETNLYINIDKDGNISTDIGLKKLIKAIYPLAVAKAEVVYQRQCNKVREILRKCV